jgi:hypothetical protein
MADLDAALAALDPPPTSANDAFKRLGGRRGEVLAAYRRYRADVPVPAVGAAPPGLAMIWRELGEDTDLEDLVWELSRQ